MNGKITNTAVSKLAPQATPFELNDDDLKGFGVRMQPSGVASYFARYRLRGKQTRFVIGRTTEFTATQARDAAKRILSSVNLGTDPSDIRKPASGSMNLEKFIDDELGPWLLTNRKSGDATVKRLKKSFKSFLMTPLSEITPHAIEKWRTARTGPGKESVSPATANRDLVALKSAMSRAKQWGFLTENKLTLVKPAKLDSNGLVRYLDAEERASLLTTLLARDQRKRDERISANRERTIRGLPTLREFGAEEYPDYLHPAIVLSLHTGIRQGELTALTWDDINLDSKLMTIRGSSAKSGTTRHVPLNSTAAAVVNRWKGNVDRSGLVFPSRDGSRLVEIKTAWHGIMKQAGIGNFRWHDMRHDFASCLVMAGIDLNTVRELLGHADLKMTLRYAHLAPAHKAAAVEMLSK
ncbi:MAG: site-specific integrase [Burkholderiales bacterium]|nr:site-specific integrase [Burkholderiales bacterium]